MLSQSALITNATLKIAKPATTIATPTRKMVVRRPAHVAVVHYAPLCQALLAWRLQIIWPVPLTTTRAQPTLAKTDNANT